MSTYEVKAELVIDDKKARKAIARIQRSLGSLIRQLDTVNKKMARMGTTMAKAQKKSAVGGGKGGGGGAGVGSYMMAGAALGGLMLGARAISGQVSAASEFRKEMEMGQLGLATMYNLVDKMPLAKSMARANDQMLKFNAMAAEAPGSGQDMLDIYSRLYGPMKKLGVASSVIEDSVKGTAVMGKAFGIKDVGALGRDVEEMLTGRAGKRTTKIFAMANAWGLMNIEAREFNALSPEKRLEITMGLMERFGPLGKQMAQTWEGASEAFGGWLNIIRDLSAKGLFDKLGKELYEINQEIMRGLPSIKGYMTMLGDIMGKTAGGAMSLAKSTAKGSGLNPIVAGEAGLAGGIVAGTAALAVFTGMMAKFLLPAAALAKVGAIVASIGLGPILAVAAVAILALVAGFQLMTKHADTFGRFMIVLFSGPLGVLIHILSSGFWALVAVMRTIISVVARVLTPVLQAFYMVAMTLGVALLVVTELFRIMAESLSRIFGSFAGMGEAASSMEQFTTRIKIMAAAVVGAIGMMFVSIMRFIAPIIRHLSGGLGMKAAKVGIIIAEETANAVERILAPGFTSGAGGYDEKGVKEADYNFEENAPGGGKKFQAPAQINVQRMIINQDFKGKADPDRVVASFLRAVTDQAEGALSSPFDNHGRA